MLTSLSLILRKETNHRTEKAYLDQASSLAKGPLQISFQHRYEILMFLKELTAKINKSIEQQMVSAASSGKLTIMKNTMPDGYVLSRLIY
jgi:hypothetical protein